MNAVLNSTVDETTRSAAAAVTVAREKLAQATATLDRARTVSQAATQALHAQEEDDDAAIARHKERLQRWVLHGHSGSPPALVMDFNRAQAKVTAQATARAAAENVTHFEALEADARAVLAQSERARQGLQNRRMTAEADRIAARVVELRAEESELCARLVALDLDSTHSLKRGLLSVEAARTLTEPPPRPHLDQYMFEGVVLDRHTPLGGHATMLDAARKFWAKFTAHE